MSKATGTLSAIAEAAIRIRAEAMGERHDAERAVARDFRLLGADLYARATRLEQLATTLDHVRRNHAP